MERDWNKANWRKSSTSESGGCVEVAHLDGVIGVRDTKAKGAGPVLEFTEIEWRAFLTGAQNGEFNMGRLAK